MLLTTYVNIHVFFRAAKSIVHSSECWPFKKPRWPVNAGARGSFTLRPADTCALLDPVRRATDDDRLCFAEDNAAMAKYARVTNPYMTELDKDEQFYRDTESIAFPKLDDRQLAMLEPLGVRRIVRRGELVYKAGQRNLG